jgi:threonyl-tRNA synthetase
MRNSFFIRVEQVYGDIQLCDGPALSEGGFFYEFSMGQKSVTTDDHGAIEDAMYKILKKRFFSKISLGFNM